VIERSNRFLSDHVRVRRSMRIALMFKNGAIYQKQIEAVKEPFSVKKKKRHIVPAKRKRIIRPRQSDGSLAVRRAVNMAAASPSQMAREAHARVRRDAMIPEPFRRPSAARREKRADAERAPPFSDPSASPATTTRPGHRRASVNAIAADTARLLFSSLAANRPRRGMKISSQCWQLFTSRYRRSARSSPSRPTRVPCARLGRTARARVRDRRGDSTSGVARRREPRSPRGRVRRGTRTVVSRLECAP